VLSALALATVLYTVKPGDTLSGVAQQYNTTWMAIYDDNQSTIRNPNMIFVGQQILRSAVLRQLEHRPQRAGP
jgi:nucleoid-associated protein YgaU